jgi:D-alanine-D-alanine ligase
MTTIILFGGLSDERHVSVASAQNVARTIGGLAWFWTPAGAVHDVALSDLLAHQRPFEIDFTPSRPAIFPTLEQALDTMPVEDPVMFLALHGGEGEDGTVQTMLEQRGIPFTGSGSQASADAFEKDRAKSIVAPRVPVADSRVAKDGHELRDAVDELLRRHERIVLKPLSAGSSRGLFFLGRNDDAGPVLEQIETLKIPYLIEQFLEGRELTVGVIDRGDGNAIALPVIEIEVDPGHSFDYEGKYLGKGTREICPARIPQSMAEEVQRAAVAAHEALGCYGYSRSDFVSSEQGTWFLELNTLPGLTTSSLVPQELAEAGIDFREFLEEQLALARRRG